MKLPDFLQRHDYAEIRLVGPRIGLFHVVERFQEGMSPEQIHEEYPSLPLAMSTHGIACYEANREEVDEYVAVNRAELDRQQAEPRPGPVLAELRSRMAAKLKAEAG